MAADSIEDILKKSGITDTVGEHALFRQDTHGSEYFMCGELSEAAATYLAKYYNDLGHHQSYWAEIPKKGVGVLTPPEHHI